MQAQLKEILVDFEMKMPVFIYADKDMISLVIRNLLSNAIKFTPEKGMISIGIIQNHSNVEIFVQDTGVGMSKEVIEKLFGNNFYTTRGTANETGTGLGLMLCKDFLIKNGGNLHISSKLGAGSRFSFNLPKKAA